MNERAFRRQELRAIGRNLTPEAVAASEALWADAALRALRADTTVRRDLAYGDHARHRLDLFLPPTTSGAAPPAVFLFVHGGGFTGGDKHRAGSYLYDNVGHWTAAQGLAAANINYRLAPEHGWPSAAEDIARAIDWLGTQAQTLGIDASRVVLAGHSAGAAHVAGYIAHRGRHSAGYRRLRGAVLLSGIYDVPAMGSRPSVQAYYGSDPAHHAARSSADGLAEAELPLLLTVAEEDPDGFHAQALTLMRHIEARRKRLPAFCVVPSHNHFTQLFHLGSEDSLLARFLSVFLEANLGAFAGAEARS